jgi:hypothetical protein
VYRCATALVTCHLTETFFGLALPRTYIFGSKTLPHQHESLLQAGGVPIAVVPDAGHAMPDDNPEAFAAIIASTLSRSELPPPYRHLGRATNAAAQLAEAAPNRKA